MDTAQHARTLLAENQYAVLATAGADGTPWVTPVWFAPDALDRIVWVSWPGARHSRLIAARPEIALTVFDSRRPPGEAAAFYATARAGLCPDEDLEEGLAIFNARSQEVGLSAFGRDALTGDARLRLYVAHLTEAWVLDQDAPVDQRAPVPR